jgi:hypothetical protein
VFQRWLISIYGSGHTIATAIRETRQETIKTVLTRTSVLMANGTNIKLIQNQVGHSGAAMALKYTQPEKEAQLEMAQQIEDIDRNLFEKSKKRIEKIEAKKKRLLDVLQGKDVWTTDVRGALVLYSGIVAGVVFLMWKNAGAPDGIKNIGIILGGILPILFVILRYIIQEKIEERYHCILIINQDNKTAING